MRADMTLAELKTYCSELCEKYGENDCCRHCDFENKGCCSIPEEWDLTEENTPGIPAARPDWEAMYHQLEEKCRELDERLADAEYGRESLLDEKERLRTIVSTVETVLGRKF